MSGLTPEQENPIKSTIRLEHQTLKEYSQSYFWGNQIKSIVGKVAPGLIKFFTKKGLYENDAKLITSNCIRVFWRVKGKLWGNNGQQVDLVVLGDCSDFEYRSEKIGLESVELFINKTGEIVSDIKLTFFDLQKGDRERYTILEVEPMIISPKKLAKMNNLCEFISEIIEMALKENTPLEVKNPDSNKEIDCKRD